MFVKWFLRSLNQTYSKISGQKVYNDACFPYRIAKEKSGRSVNMKQSTRDNGITTEVNPKQEAITESDFKQLF